MFSSGTRPSRSARLAFERRSGISDCARLISSSELGASGLPSSVASVTFVLPGWCCQPGRAATLGSLKPEHPPKGRIWSPRSVVKQAVPLTRTGRLGRVSIGAGRQRGPVGLVFLGRRASHEVPQPVPPLHPALVVAG